RRVHLPPYIAALQAGAQVVMASFSRWNGVKLHAHRYLLTDVLKSELGFSGFVVSDWGGIDQVDPDPYRAAVLAINAGIDMSMVPQDYERFIYNLKRAVQRGDIPLGRIDDAVGRILRVKFAAGLYERPIPDGSLLPLVGSESHRQLARQAVAHSLVLLKNTGQTLPLAKDLSTILVAGQAADDIGLQCGGWTIEWLGKPGDITPGTTLLEGICAAVSPSTQVHYGPQGRFEQFQEEKAPVGIACLAEMPYAEGFGDREDLNLPPEDILLLERLRPRCEKLVVILFSGRPLILTTQLPLMDALVVAWLPGSEGQGVADVLFGDLPFTGRLPCPWPENMGQIPLRNMDRPLFPFGYGLRT
ncbi:MAG: glycoside hydrolase family 3 C-terminal domain-containing protein, partial [Candidatus Bathyarchaeia archaeon]